MGKRDRTPLDTGCAMYEPGGWISRVSPTPLLLVVALQDKMTVTDLALAGYERGLGARLTTPKSR